MIGAKQICKRKKVFEQMRYKSERDEHCIIIYLFGRKQLNIDQIIINSVNLKIS